MRRGALALAVASLLSVAAPAQAATKSASAFALNYLTPVVRINPGDSLLFKNLDPLAYHNIASNIPGLFQSPLIGQGTSAMVVGVSTLVVGNYQFHCSLHPWMKGALVVRKLLG